jgi:protein involved in polysaccharide export with SLBB domain
VNFVKCIYIYGNVLKTKIFLIFFLASLLSVYLVGCGDKVQLPSGEELAAFQAAGPSAPTIDMQRVARARLEVGAYHTVPGDVLELNMPIVLQVLVTEAPDFPDKIAPYLCRVRDNGTIDLPMAGEIKAAGKTLAEIESAIIDAYYPTYSKTRPSVIARIAEYKTHKISITGAVKEPGIYELHSDQLSLVALLMQAGGIIEEGATRIQITHADQTQVVSDKRTSYEPYNHSIGYAVQTNQAEEVMSSSHYFDSIENNRTGVQMTFQQVSQSSTIGQLTIRHGQTILLSEQIDITNENQRWSVLDKLAETEPHVATDEVGKIWVRLCGLAEMLKNPGIQETDYRIQKPALSIAEGAEYSRQTVNKMRVTRDDWSGDETIVLPVRGLNIPFADVALQDGDSVIVERLREQLITVVGLVNRPGTFPYPPDVEYNLMQALGLAGGLNLSAEPRYATVYRLRSDGITTSFTFNIIDVARSKDPTYALSIPLKPYDVVAVEHTPRTRAKVFWDRVFRIYLSTYLRLEDILGYED